MAVSTVSKGNFDSPVDSQFQPNGDAFLKALTEEQQPRFPTSPQDGMLEVRESGGNTAASSSSAAGFKPAPGTGTIDQNFAGCTDVFPGGTPPDISGSKYTDKIHQIANNDPATGKSIYAVTYSGQTKTPIVSSEHLTKADLLAGRDVPRSSNAFMADDRIPEDERAELDDYKGYINVDRGHMSPSADMPTKTADRRSFLLSNMVPQAANQNEGVWAAIEGGVRDKVIATGNDLFVASGPAFRGDTIQKLNDRVYIPSDTWKAVYDPKTNTAGVYWVENKNQNPRVEIISFDELKKRTGIDPFPTLAGSIRSQTNVPSFSNHPRNSSHTDDLTLRGNRAA